MIRTVTLNSGFDEFYTVSNFSFGGVGDVIEHTTLPSGKGFNVARAARLLGEKVKAYGLVGAPDREEFEARLSEEGIDAALVAVPGRTRRNVTLLNVTDGGPAAHVKGPGFALESEAPFSALLGLLRDETGAGDIVTLNGSTPRGLPDDAWAECGRAAREKGALLVVDVSGEPLRRVLDRCPVLACKPNEEEIRAISGGGPDRDGAVRQALDFMSSRSVTLPVVTLGKDGLRFVADGRTWSARCDVPGARVFVGAGDACLAGLAAGLSRDGNSLADAVRFGVAAASAHVRGTDAPAFAGEVERMLSSVEIELL
jgi:1-phosphofructokinase